MSKEKIVYVINPRSGLGEKQKIEQVIREKSDTGKVDFEIIYTKRRGQAHQIGLDQRDKASMVVAVGGDGTVNEVGTALIGSQTVLGIIPSGSGNGLARALDIPMRYSLAIDVLNEAQTRKIDVIKIGDHTSLNVAGIGFDAFISHKFQKKRTRGPIQYVNLIAREFPLYEAHRYRLNIDTHIFDRKAFLISFANSSQWGNNVHIAPGARLDDGLIDVCIISEFPNIAIPALVISLLNQEIDKNKYDEIIRAKSIELGNEEPILAHVDGEPVIVAPHATVSVEHLALNVVVPTQQFLDRHRYTPSLMVDMMQQRFPNLPNIPQFPTLDGLPKPVTLSEFINDPSVVKKRFNELKEITKNKQKNALK